MACKVEQPLVAAIWPALLASKRFADDADDNAPGALWLLGSAAGWSVAASAGAPDKERHRFRVFARLDAGTPAPAHATHEFCLDRFAAGEAPLRACNSVDLHPQVETILRIYLPIVLSGWRARRSREVFVAAHIAQTLDGRIACRNGHSQWISNEANLWHAHRLRALHDVVLVGSRTVRADDPQLTVRHVEGRDPVRVVLSGNATVLDLAAERRIFAAPGFTLVCRDAALAGRVRNGAEEHVDVCALPGDEAAAPLSPDAVFTALAARGWHSVFVEGGGATLSGFLDAGRIDLLHVHVAPMILGSGIPGFSLPEVQNIRDSRHLRMEHFEMDEELLFECRLAGEDDT